MTLYYYKNIGHKRYCFLNSYTIILSFFNRSIFNNKIPLKRTYLAVVAVVTDLRFAMTSNGKLENWHVTNIEPSTNWKKNIDTAIDIQELVNQPKDVIGKIGGL